MRKITATILKEWLLLKRDVAGILLLFIMPAVLIVVMALIQDAPYKDYQEARFDMLLADNDGGSLAHQITDGLKKSKNFHVTDTLDGKPVTTEVLKAQVQKGKYKIGIIIPKGVTAEVVNSSNIVVNSIAKKIGLEGIQPTREMRDMHISMYFDPVAKPAFRSSISAALEKYITFSCTKVLMQRLSVLNKGGSEDTSSNINFARIMQGIGVQEEPLNDSGKYAHYVTSVEHNVPAWAIFGMFFIVIPIAGHMIREREDGSALRVALIPNVRQQVALGRIFFYTVLCTIQFLLMMGIGIWAMPWFGLPSLRLGAHPWLLVPVAACIAFAATTYGYFAGAVFKTINQALPFGSISIVIFSAIGGVWVPVEILPRVMKKIAMISPLHWSLEAVDQIIIRDGGIKELITPLLTLLAIAIAFLVVSFIVNSRRVQSVQ